MSLNTIFC